MKPDPDAPPLTFAWHLRERRLPGLIKWLFVTLAAMTGFSYLFKVVYPQSERSLPASRQITVLNPADPATRSLLHRVADRDFMVVPDTQASHDIRLEDHVPVFHPTYENHQFQLMDLPHQSFTVPDVRLMDPAAPLLPPPDLSRLKKSAVTSSAVSKAAPTLTLVFSGALAGRKILRPPDLSTLRLTDPDAWRFHLGVDSHGTVSFDLPISTGKPATLAADLVNRLNAMHFEAAPSNTEDPGTQGQDALTWDIATFQWTKPGTP